MPVTSEITTALGGIFSTQKALAANLSALEKPTRARKASATTAVADSSVLVFGADLEIETIRDDVVVGLDTVIRETTAAMHGLGVADRFAAELETVLGKPGDATTVAAALDALSRAFAGLAQGPDEGAVAVETAARDVTGQFRRLAQHIQALRAKADRQLGEAVGKARVVLDKIAAVNQRAARACAQGVDPATARANHGPLLTALSSFLEFSFFGRGDGTLCLVTKAGSTLVDGTRADLSFTVATTPVEATMTVARGDLGSVMAFGKDIRGEIGTGSLSALLAVRDTTLPNLQSQIDTLAQTMQSRLNQVVNRAIGEEGARTTYLGSRSFAAPGAERIALAGGDTVVRLVDENGAPLAATALGALMKRHRRSRNAPETGQWSMAEVATAFDGWLATQCGPADAPYARIDETGRFVIHLPKGPRLALRDQRSVTLRSTLAAPADRPLGLSGRLAISDGTGLYRISGVQPSESLAALAARIRAIDGLQANLVPVAAGVALEVTSARGADLVVEADAPGTSVATTLGLLPAPDTPQEDVAVSLTASYRGAALTSRPLADSDRPLGIGGMLVLRDDAGNRVGIAFNPSWNTAAAARAIVATGIPGLTTALPIQGGYAVLKISVPSGAISAEGIAGALCSAPVTAFAAVGGRLTVLAEGAVVGHLDIPVGADLNAIADAINDTALPFAPAGIDATVVSVGDRSWLEIAAKSGATLTVQGSALGTEPGRLAFAPSPRDWLGLAPPPQQTILGFANFLGLNDLFVAEPASAFDSKTPTGVFATTATPGTAGALALADTVDSGTTSPLACPAVASGAATLFDTPLNLAAAGGMPRGTHTLTQYADAIVRTAWADRKTTQGQIAYHQVLLDGLIAQKVGLPAIDIDHEIRNLNSYRLALHDSSRVISTISQLFNSLAA